MLSTHLLPDVERICYHAVIMDHGHIRFAGTVEALRGAGAVARAGGTPLVVQVKADAERLSAALAAAGATCEVIAPTTLGVQLAAGTTTALVFRTALACGVQVRSLDVRRESLETAFVRIIEQAAAS